ncbi:ATPase-like protein [Mycolicibacterium mageritense DSM 44476 = CIP 104973]|uniref:LuxR family transcriptional regulator n=1 Tax=Mycolicibacterium mageritense TaxID=53462 RepID=A0ABM7I0G8_MYCME|nr:LuxR family transcriptional regulator [Mycolicibacterium mageritense]MCC9183752.1 AAA family ATPase [Mycolicibacterium mageritense]BBX36379.1 LuxR family transcriptional regulator [Mycolicibacterium mageritense]
MLHGRAAELGAIRACLAHARTGRSSVLLVVGEAGSGKTALLDRAVEDAGDFRILRCTGVESEAELPFAALHLLLHNDLDQIGKLPAPQAAAVRAAFGLAEAPGVDRLLAGLATLGLLSEIATDTPLLCLVDDAQWVDRASLDALLFAGRRFGAEGVVLLIASREDLTAADLPAVRLGGLCQSAAVALLAERAAALTPDQRDRVLMQSQRNPLALIEFAAAQQSGGLGAVTDAAHRVIDAFEVQVRRLPAATRRLLLVMAADDTGELGVLLAASASLDLGPADFRPAENAGLIQLSVESAVFRHPLIRSAVYRAASITDRGRAHRALATALSADGYADRRAWHLASAAVGFDAAAADALEAAAVRAERRGGYAAATAGYERAARLTADPDIRGRRLAAGAACARDSAQLDRAASMATDADRLTTDPRNRARLAWVRARVEFERGTPRRASELMLDGAGLLTGIDDERAAQMLVESGRMAYFADAAPSLGRLIEAIDGIDLPRNHPLRAFLAATSIVAKLQAGWPGREVPPLPPVVHAIAADSLGATVGNLPAHSAFLNLVIGDADEAMAQAGRMLAEARERGLIGGLPHILLTAAQAALLAGRLSDALHAAEEGIRISEDTGQQHSAVNLRAVLARVTAMTGDADRCRALAEETIASGVQRHSLSSGLAQLALATLDLGSARYASALDRLAAVPEPLQRHPGFVNLAAPEWAEAASRSEQPERAADAMRNFEAWAEYRDNPVVYAGWNRCRALLAADDRAEDHFTASLRLYRTINRPLGLARTQLLYGEWLRRMRRRSESRAPLRRALHVFEQAAARSWAERARAELRATGERVSSGAEYGGAVDRLTAQELQVVRLAAAGLSNRDIGAQLFISPRTAGYHLYKAFPKLGVADRRELGGLDLH